MGVLPKLSDKDFIRLSSYITEHLGIKLPSSKKMMLEARIQKRLRVLKLPNHTAYVEYLFSEAGMRDEMGHLQDAVTTNTTHFFREPKHFDILQGKVLPELVKRRGPNQTIELWSAGCSSGQEPYTLAMILSNYREKSPGLKFNILGSDISLDVLKKAMNAIYPMDVLESIPLEYRKKYLLRSKDRSKNIFRIAPELRRMIRYRRINFMQPFDVGKGMDIIFCRNVVIYFDRKTQEKLFSRLCAQLSPGGYLFIGHSESITGMPLPVRQVAPTVYQLV